jgi:hypothetical protein
VAPPAVEEVGDDAAPPQGREKAGGDWGEALQRITAFLADDALAGREEGSPGGVAARQFLVDELLGCGIRPLAETGFEQPIATGQGTNLLGVIEGTAPSLKERHLLLGAHYDHLGECGGQICNGAYDNATAVAAVLVVGCAVAQSPLPRSVVIALWDAEESPTFLTPAMGSEHFARHPLVPLEQVEVAIALDLVGADLWPGFAPHFVLGAETSPEVQQLVAGLAPPEGLPLYRFGLHLPEDQPTGHQAWSDYDPFRDRNVPVLFLTGGQNKFYHTPHDELAQVNFPKLLLETQYLWSLTTSLAAMEGQTSFVAGGDDYAADARAVAELLSVALGTGGLVESLQLTETSGQLLAADFEAVRAVVERLDGGAQASQEEVRVLRRAVQRLMCLAGSVYAEALCAYL